MHSATGNKKALPLTGHIPESGFFFEAMEVTSISAAARQLDWPA